MLPCEEDGDFDGYTSKDDSESSRRRFYLMKKLGLLTHDQDKSPIKTESIAIAPIEIENVESKCETASNDNTSSTTVLADDENIKHFLEEESAVREETTLVGEEMNPDNSKEDTDECISDIALDAENDLELDSIKSEEEITNEGEEIQRDEVKLEEVVESFSNLDVNENREETNSQLEIETESTVDNDSAIDSQESPVFRDCSLEEIRIVSNDEGTNSIYK